MDRCRLPLIARMSASRADLVVMLVSQVWPAILPGVQPHASRPPALAMWTGLATVVHQGGDADKEPAAEDGLRNLAGFIAADGSDDGESHEYDPGNQPAHESSGRGAVWLFFFFFGGGRAPAGVGRRGLA